MAQPSHEHVDSLEGSLRLTVATVSGSSSTLGDHGDHAVAEGGKGCDADGVDSFEGCLRLTVASFSGKGCDADGVDSLEGSLRLTVVSFGGKGCDADGVDSTEVSLCHGSSCKRERVGVG